MLSLDRVNTRVFNSERCLSLSLVFVANTRTQQARTELFPRILYYKRDLLNRKLKYYRRVKKTLAFSDKTRVLFFKNYNLFLSRVTFLVNRTPGTSGVKKFMNFIGITSNTFFD